jgi:hypothetical protein
MERVFRYRRYLICALPLLLLCLLIGCKLDLFGSGSSDDPVRPGPPRNNVPASIEGKAQRLINNLVANGYEVARGYFFAFGIDQCPTAIAIMGNCYGNNPVAPYLLYAVPAWSDEYVDPSTKDAFGQLPDGYISIRRFDPREALVILGLLPPPGRYFGYQTYLFTKKGTINTDDNTYRWIQANAPSMLNQFFSVSPNPDRLTIFGSIGNSINNVVIEEQAGSAFNQERFFITTADQTMEANMKAALLAAGVPNVAQIFAEPVSSDYTVGLSQDANDFAVALRYAMPQDTDAGSKWRSDLPLVVLRVRDKNTSRPVVPYPRVTLDTRTANPEAGLATDLQNLVGAVKNDWGQASAVTHPFFDSQNPNTVDFVGPDCNLNHGGPDHGMNCLGDSQDTVYYGSLNLSLDNNEVYAVIGTLLTETGNASYVNLSIYDSAAMFGVVSIDDARLVATANKYADEAGNTEKFYVYYITRDCSKYVLTSSGACTSITEEMIPRTKQVRLVQRGYIRPGTARGALSTQPLVPILVALAGGG